ncbi:MAG TPA: nucleotidyl transferase AbiEii/AbiGii toxin family protein [Gammaproteobacteria bacterium]|nr:nucleotidyl transferase AbiEii/AbiGii toxin family protein [Gammaproteobacteria bacterium]
MAALREQFLERFARALFQKRGSGFVLKGGGALRALFGPERLTQDIDLDFIGAKRSADSLHTSVHRAIAAAARGLGLTDLRVSEPGKAERSPRWKLNFSDAAGVRQHLEIEVSRDPERAPPGGVVVQKPFEPRAATGIARFWVDVYDEATLAATKLAALLGREVPRDVYDLDLLRAAAPAIPPALTAWAVARAHPDGQDPVRVLWEHLDALGYERYRAELEGSLSPDAAARLDETEWTAMKLRVGEYLERQLRVARP